MNSLGCARLRGDSQKHFSNFSKSRGLISFSNIFIIESFTSSGEIVFVAETEPLLVTLPRYRFGKGALKSILHGYDQRATRFHHAERASHVGPNQYDAVNRLAKRGAIHSAVKVVQKVIKHFLN